MIFVRYTETPVGLVTLTSDGEALIGLFFEEERHPRSREGALEEPDPILLDAERQVQEYFGKWRRSFDLPLRPEGTAFQREVWKLLEEIPYGETVSYMYLARKMGKEKAVRAVGMANGRNPISIVIPCHRVIGADGKLVGYGGGMWRKEFLLDLEGAREKRLF